MAGKPKIAVNMSNCVRGESGNTLASFATWFAKAAEHFEIVPYGDEIDPPHPSEVFLFIDSNCMQFRGDWEAWWLAPVILMEFKPWFDGGPKGCDDATEAPASD